ncbi:4082_t:CDS:2 [Acaulospora morrowiae]|uniref:4082_t:CDS:1 n=1 Tax=Acaulospora morrowiae TaxID=94023 RepID=A0A9N9GMQ9_9GLOM|nr:4082_t:CDS:2 [Acaulospora morrowiae]
MERRSFNDVPTMPNCRNGIPGQTKVTFITNLVENGAANGSSIVFSFPNGTAIGIWVGVRHQTGVPDICHSVTRITKIGATRPVDIEDFSYILLR